jgi:Protein of unknown function (DUF2510)
MSLPSSSTTPPGWYPDPSGERKWRVWTGTSWSELTRPYGELASNDSIAPSLGLIQALSRLTRYGVLAVFAGLGLMVNLLQHWPNTKHPVPMWFAVTASNTAIAMFIIGTLCFAFALKELEGKWTVASFIPLVNVMVTSSLIAERLGSKGLRRAFAETLLIAIYIVQSKTQPWIIVALMLATYDNLRWTYGLYDQLMDRRLSA